MEVYDQLYNYEMFNKIRFFGGYASEKTPLWRAKRARAPWGGAKILDFCGGDKRAFSIVKRSFTIGLVVKFSLVDYADSLAFTSCDGLGSDKVYLGIDSEHGLDRLSERALLDGKILDGIRELVGAELNVNVEGIVVLYAVNLDEVVGGVAFVKKNGFDLGGEYVNAADDEHIVASAHGLCHLDECSAAGALLAGENADIAGTVTEKREAFLIKVGEYKLTLGAFGENLTGFGVDDLGVEVVLVDVHTRLLLAFECNTGAGGLGETVDIVCLDAESLLDIAAHFFCPGLSSEDTCLEVEGVGRDAHLLESFADVCGIGGSAADDGGVEILHKLDLTFGVTRGHGKSQTANLMRASVESEAAGEKTVAVSNLTNILVCSACGDDSARTAIFPEVDVVLCVVSNDSLTRRTRGRMNTNAVLKICAEKSVGVSITEVSLGEEGKLMEIIDALDVIGSYTLGVHKVAVVFYVFINVLYLLDELFGLECAHLVERHCFNFFLEVLLFCHFCFSFLLASLWYRKKEQTKTSSASEKNTEDEKFYPVVPPQFAAISR